jgi:hypothetical protein
VTTQNGWIVLNRAEATGYWQAIHLFEARTVKELVVHHSKIDCRMVEMGLGCVKTLTLAARVETSRTNCIPESQIILHTRGVMPSWRIVFSTFRDYMSFYTARVKSRKTRSEH